MTFVPVAPRLEEVNALIAAGRVVLQSFMAAKVPEEEWADLKAAVKTLEDAVDRQSLRDAVAGVSGKTPGDVILDRMQRKLD